MSWVEGEGSISVCAFLSAIMHGLLTRQEARMGSKPSMEKSQTVKSCCLQGVEFTWESLYFLLTGETHSINLMLNLMIKDEIVEGEIPRLLASLPNRGILDIRHAAFNTGCPVILYQ